MDLPERRSFKYIAVLAVSAGAILVIGWLLRPRDIPQSPPPIPSETELQELARRTERRSLDSATAFFRELATDVQASLAYVPSIGASGLLWGGAQVVTGPIRTSPVPPTVIVRTAAGERSVPVNSSRRLPLSTLTVASDASNRPAHRAAVLPKPGDRVVVVWQPSPAFAATTVSQTATTICGDTQVRETILSLALSDRMVGGGVFNMDRDLVGVILPCGDHVAAIEPSSIDTLIQRAAKLDERLLTQYGVLFDTISQEERGYFPQVDGLLVREVWTGTIGDAAGIQPGDILLAVGDRTLSRAEDLNVLLEGLAAGSGLRFRRGTKTVTIVLGESAIPAARTKNNDGFGLVIESSAANYRIGTVVPGSQAARAGVRTGDVLRRINGEEPRTRAQVERAVMGVLAKLPVLLELSRDVRRIAVVIPEAPQP